MQGDGCAVVTSRSGGFDGGRNGGINTLPGGFGGILIDYSQCSVNVYAPSSLGGGGLGSRNGADATTSLLV